MSVQKILPVFLSASFAVAVVLLTVRRMETDTLPIAIASACLVAVYLLWGLMETRVTVGEAKRPSTRLDRGTFEFYSASRIATALSALWLAPAQGLPQIVVGGGMVILAAAFRVQSIRTLGAAYSHRIRVIDNHQIITSGPYRLIRHPAYAGMLLAHLGFCIAFFNWVTLALLAVALTPAVVLRILHEEKVLMGIEGYPAYAATRKRLIPAVW